MNISLTIILVTYNHEKYIDECLKSIINQKFDKSKIQLIIAEDYSTDKTREVIDKYCFQDFGVVDKLYRSKNIGLIKNFIEALNKAHGRYIATISGDDFWMNENKLIKQIDIFKQHQNISAVYTAVTIITRNKKIESPIQFNQNKIIGINNIDNLMHFPCGINASSIMFVNENIESYIEVIQNFDFEDFILFHFLIKDNKSVYFLNEKLSCYRKLDNSLSNTYSNLDLLLKKYEMMIYLNIKYYSGMLREKIKNDFLIEFNKMMIKKSFKRKLVDLIFI